MDLYIVGAGGLGREVLDACLVAGRTAYPGADVSGSADLGLAATMGSNAVVLQGLSVGARVHRGCGRGGDA